MIVKHDLRFPSLIAATERTLISSRRSAMSMANRRELNEAQTVTVGFWAVSLKRSCFCDPSAERTIWRAVCHTLS